MSSFVNEFLCYCNITTIYFAPCEMHKRLVTCGYVHLKIKVLFNVILMLNRLNCVNILINHGI